jgi:hypothetical protein
MGGAAVGLNVAWPAAATKEAAMHTNGEHPVPETRLGPETLDPVLAQIRAALLALVERDRAQHQGTRTNDAPPPRSP